MLQGYPVEGQIDVPTTFGLFSARVRGVDRWLPICSTPVFELRDRLPRTGLGRGDASPVVCIEASRSSLTWLSIADGFHALHRPSLDVTLHAAMEVSVSLSFTGPAPALSPIPPPSVSAHPNAHVLRQPRPVPRATAQDGTCRSTFPADVIVLSYRAHRRPRAGSGDFLPDGELIGYLQRGPFFVNLLPALTGDALRGPSQTSDRAPNGTFGEPLMLCGRDGPSYRAKRKQGRCLHSAGLTHDDGGLTPGSPPLPMESIASLPKVAAAAVAPSPAASPARRRARRRRSACCSPGSGWRRQSGSAVVRVIAEARC